MREYEVTVIFQPQLEEQPRTDLIEQVAGCRRNGKDITDAVTDAEVYGDKAAEAQKFFDDAEARIAEHEAKNQK